MALKEYCNEFEHAHQRYSNTKLKVQTDKNGNKVSVMEYSYDKVKTIIELTKEALEWKSKQLQPS